MVPFKKNFIVCYVFTSLLCATCYTSLNCLTLWSECLQVAASLAVTIWDGHFEYNELPVVPVSSLSPVNLFLVSLILDRKNCNRIMTVFLCEVMLNGVCVKVESS